MTQINRPPEQNRCGGGGYGGGYGGVVMGRLEEGGGYECCFTLGSGLFIGPMAEDESTQSRTESVNEEGTSSSKGVVVVQEDEEMRDQGWLQLGIGPIRIGPSQDRGLIDRAADQPTLDLLPSSGLEQVRTSSSSVSATATNVVFHVQPSLSSSVLQQYPGGNSGLGFPHHQKINTNWGFMHPQSLSQNITTMQFPATASTSSFLMPGGSYLGRPFQAHGGGGGGGGVGSSSGFTVIDPPRRPHSGLWFVLQVSQNQSKEPFLPQIPKSYLRIKDGRMTVRLLMKYLVNKLKLDSESEIEIRCREQRLLPFLTLQHVRDHIWRNSADTTTTTLLPESSSTTDHVMVLHYARSP